MVSLQLAWWKMCLVHTFFFFSHALRRRRFHHSNAMRLPLSSHPGKKVISGGPTLSMAAEHQLSPLGHHASLQEVSLGELADTIADDFEELFSPSHSLEEASSDHFGAFHDVDERQHLVVDLFGDSTVTLNDKSHPLTADLVNAGLEDTLMDLSSEANVSMAGTFYL
jgi:hypothetical protein